MEFFDRKEEVIDIQLTQYGKHLLSKGKFSPVFYSFHDDDVIYDAKFANDNGENQEKIEDRIKSTPRMKSQYSFSGRDLKTNKVDTGICKEQMSVCNKLQVSKEKHYGLGLPLGTSEMNSHKYPAWSVRFLEGVLSGSSYNIKAGKEEAEFTFLSDNPLDYVVSGPKGDEYVDLNSVSGKTYRFYFLTSAASQSPPDPTAGKGVSVSLTGLSTKETIAAKFKTRVASLNEDGKKIWSAKVDAHKITVVNNKYGPVKNSTVSGDLSGVMSMSQKTQGKAGVPKYVAIPQLDITLKTRVGVTDLFGKNSPTVLPTSFMYQTPLYEDGSQIYYNSEQLILELIENNAPLLMENVDVEVFKADEDENGIEELIPLMFQKPIDFVVDDILLDAADISKAREKNVREYGTHMVDYFLDLAIDREIDVDINKIDEGLRVGVYLGRDRNEDDTPCDDDDVGDNTTGGY